MRRVLFVCTGNIFRSLTAEHALRRALPGGSRIAVASAGTDDFPHVVRPNVREYLYGKGFDVSSHQRRTLTRGLIEDSDLVIAMSTDHRAHIRDRFQKDALLFLEACGGPGEPRTCGHRISAWLRPALPTARRRPCCP